MHWADSIAKALSHRSDTHVVASGITPSGEFHIGHLREILTSDIIKRACIRQGLQAQFVFFVDDADPLRKVYDFLDQTMRSTSDINWRIFLHPIKTDSLTTCDSNKEYPMRIIF